MFGGWHQVTAVLRSQINSSRSWAVPDGTKPRRTCGQRGPDELARCPNRRISMGTISVMRTGHHRLADGSLLRVDIELGSWVGSLYTRDMRVKTRVVGSDVEVHAWAGRVQRNKVAS
jgi:hypothetical protein